jgi:hypothetical protein
VEGRVRSLADLCEICGGQSGTGTGFSVECFGFLLPVLCHQCPLLFFIFILLLPDRQAGKALNLETKQCSCGYHGALR